MELLQVIGLLLVVHRIDDLENVFQHLQQKAEVVHRIDDLESVPCCENA